METYTVAKEYLRERIAVGYHSTQDALGLFHEGKRELALHHLSRANSSFITIETMTRINEELTRLEFTDLITSFETLYTEALENDNDIQHIQIFFDVFKKDLKVVLDLIDSPIELD
ncbi:hypothetical protein WDR10_11195 [Kurthia gibsonii]|uniref:hypothetical protein n=1 Tax=Kurthia gibsonii TaxID=33946 RepID=UPI0030CBE90C